MLDDRNMQQLVYSIENLAILTLLKVSYMCEAFKITLKYEN